MVNRDSERNSRLRKRNAVTRYRLHGQGKATSLRNAAARAPAWRQINRVIGGSALRREGENVVPQTPGRRQSTIRRSLASTGVGETDGHRADTTRRKEIDARFRLSVPYRNVRCVQVNDATGIVRIPHLKDDIFRGVHHRRGDNLRDDHTRAISEFGLRETDIHVGGVVLGDTDGPRAVVTRKIAPEG